MNKQMKDDVADLPDIVEAIIKGFSKLSAEEQVDVSARLNAVRLKCEKHNEAVKDTFKAKFKRKGGVVPGVAFEAVVSYGPVTRLDQKYLEVTHPEEFNDSLKASYQYRVDYKAR